LHGARTKIYISLILAYRYNASQKYTGLGKLCGMIKEMIAELRAITGIYDYALFQHKRFKNKYETSP
jgi:hypothetical protein